MNKWTQDEEQILMNCIEEDDSETTQERIEHAHYMMYSKEEGAHPDLEPRTLKSCIARYYKVCERRQNER
tara:strand:+ start:171 stop:380 length:210 start_codon:yes stop_codon:yes gene_type:complete